MEKQIMWAALVAVGGWMWFYLFFRQLVFSFTTALPMIKRFNSQGTELISVNARRYAYLSVLVWVLISGGIAAAVIALCKLYLWLSFLGGGLVGLILYWNRMTAETQSNFNAFCTAYYRFVADDELRTAMYNNKIPQMKTRLTELGVDKNKIIPDFKREK